jgi:hypothetical protein
MVGVITGTLASIWATNNLAGIVISVKTLGLKFLPYIDIQKGRIIIIRAMASFLSLTSKKIWPCQMKFRSGQLKH